MNCAGIGAAARTVGREGPLDLAAFDFVIQVNLVGTFNTLRLCANHMAKNEPIGSDGERGVIINTASVAAYDGQIGQAAYSASKGGVRGRHDVAHRPRPGPQRHPRVHDRTGNLRNADDDGRAGPRAGCR